MYFSNDPELFLTFAYILGIGFGCVLFALFLILSKLSRK